MRRDIRLSLILVAVFAIFSTCFTLSFLYQDYYISTVEKGLEDISRLYRGEKPKDLTIEPYKNLPPKAKNTIAYDAVYKNGYLRVSTPLEGLNTILLPALIMSTGILMISIFLIGIITNYLLDIFLGPMEIIEDSLGNILSSKDIDESLFKKELAPTINTINLYREQADYYILQLEKAEKFRREFTANVTHELKTPLTSINGYAELIEHNMVKGEDLKKIGQVIRQEGSRLLELIDSIIELSNLENPDLKVEFEDLDLMDIINSTVNKLRTRIEAKNIDLILNLQPSPIKANTRMINDLAFNLLDNSIKYNVQGGKIFISLRENEESISFFIGDTGIGISEKDLVRIFERFYIVDKSRNKNLNSTGLGLSIVKHIVEIHRAKINISSRPSLGTEIEIIFKKP